LLATLLAVDGPDTVALTPVTKAGLADWLAGQSPAIASWVKAVGFTGEAGSTVFLPGPDGAVAHVLAGVSAVDDLWAFAGLPSSLPAGSYRIDAALDARAATRAALGWALGSYRFSRYKKPSEKGFANLVWPAEADHGEVERAATATWLVRDLVNTPACDMGPAELAQAAQDLAAEFDAAVEVIVGQDLLDRDYPAVHAVGRASPREPRLIDLRWGNP